MFLQQPRLRLVDLPNRDQLHAGADAIAIAAMDGRGCVVEAERSSAESKRDPIVVSSVAEEVNGLSPREDDASVDRCNRSPVA